MSKPKPICPRTGCGRPAMTEALIWSPETRSMKPTLFCPDHAVEVERDRFDAIAQVEARRAMERSR